MEIVLYLIICGDVVIVGKRCNLVVGKSDLPMLKAVFFFSF